MLSSHPAIPTPCCPHTLLSFNFTVGSYQNYIQKDFKKNNWCFCLPIYSNSCQKVAFHSFYCPLCLKEVMIHCASGCIPLQALTLVLFVSFQLDSVYLKFEISLSSVLVPCFCSVVQTFCTLLKVCTSIRIPFVFGPGECQKGRAQRITRNAQRRDRQKSPIQIG